MHQALYRKWRPGTFSSVVGQDHITSVLAHEVSEGRLNHAYLFCGSRGTGKTSCAKILAKAANCKHTVNGDPCNVCESCRAVDNGTSLDVLEMDAASNTGVDYIRDIRDEVVFAPSDMSTRVYIIDEVHMLSEGAFNALLKTLEEPPSGVIFILATTELQKIPATILSRCQRFDFRRLSVADLMSRLDVIAREEKIELDEDASRLIARLSQGGMRDAISLLELCAGEGARVTYTLVSDKAGVCGRERVISIVNNIVERDYGTVFTEVADIYRSSKDLSVFLADILNLYRDMMVIRAMHLSDRAQINPDILDVSESEFEDLKALAEKLRYPVMLYHTKLLREAIAVMSRGGDKRITAEMVLIRMCAKPQGDSPEALSARISELEDRLTAGICIAGGSTPAANTDKIKPFEEADNRRNPVAESPKKPLAADESALTPFRDWIELVSSYEKLDAGGAPFLKSCKAFITADNKLIIRISDAFALTLLQTNNAEGRLMSISGARGDSFTGIVFEQVRAENIGNKGDSSLDELL